MEKLLANWYTYIYDNMYSLNGIYVEMTRYSDAIMGVLEDGGSLHTIYVLMTSIGLGMLVVYFVISLGTRLQEKEVSPAIIFKTLLEFFVGYILALNSFDIVRNLFELGDALGAMVSTYSYGFSFEPYTESFSKCLEDFSLKDQLMYMFNALIPYGACVITNFFITYTIVSRVIRISVNAVMSPFAAANFFEGSRRSDSIRFLKRTFAMCLQCSVIMIVVAACTDLSGYMASNDQYSEGISAMSTVDTAKEEMLATAESNFSELSTDVEYAVDKLGLAAREGDDRKLKSDIKKARDNLLDEYDEVTPSREAEFQQYESLLHIEVFNRMGGSYTYDGDGHAVLKDKYITFTEDSAVKFMDAILGSGNYVVLLMLLAVKLGMIKQSMSLCNTIVGV